MCLPATLEMFQHARFSLEPLTWMAVGLAAVAGGPAATRRGRSLKVSHVVDLTQTLSPEFPSWPGYPSLEVRNTHNYARDGFFANAWHVHEHSGTHIDAPLHFSAQGWSAAEIPRSPQSSLISAARCGGTRIRRCGWRILGRGKRNMDGFPERRRC
jgi:hypothetical protein